MSADEVIAALQLPAEARLHSQSGQRIPKKLLLERSRGTSAQKRSLQDGIEELLWVASLKPNTVGVSAYRDEAREYLEIAVLLVRLRESAKGEPAGGVDSPGYSLSGFFGERAAWGGVAFAGAQAMV